MADKDRGAYMTPEELQSLMKAAISAAVSEATKLNPLEQKTLDEEIQKEKRRAILAVELGHAEEVGRYNRQNSCTHSRNEKSGNPVSKGMGEWTTGGQLHDDGTATLICQRCATAWRFIPSKAEREYFINAEHGMGGCPPPPIDRCINREEFITSPPVHPNLAEVVGK